MGGDIIGFNSVLGAFETTLEFEVQTPVQQDPFLVSNRETLAKFEKAMNDDFRYT
jgi:hypothetical protein